VIDGRPAVFIAHSERSKDSVALPFRGYIQSLGLVGLLVGELPRPPAVEWSTDEKVNYYLNNSSMFVALATADDPLPDGRFHTRPNIVDEISRARSKDHLRDKIQVFKDARVDLPSNLPMTWDPLDPDDLPSALARFLAQAQAWGLVARDRPLPSIADASEEPVGPTPAESEDSAGAGSDAAALSQIKGALERLRTELSGGEVDEPDAPLAAARIYLASAALLAEKRSTGLLGVHELNGLFGERGELRFNAGEERLLLKTMLGHARSDNAPGWFFFRHWTDDSLVEALIDVGLGESDDSARAQAIRLLARRPDPPPRGHLSALVRRGLDSGDLHVSSAAQDLLARHGDGRLVRGMRDRLESATSYGVAQARAQALSHSDPAAALRLLLANPNAHSRPLEEALLGSARRLPVSRLRQGLGSRNEKVRRLCLRALDRSSRVRKHDALELMAADASGSIRADALEIALKRRWSITESEMRAALEEPKARMDLERQWELAIRYYGRWPAEELIAELDWLSVRSWEIYAALAREHFSAINDRIRADLENGFEELKQSTKSRIEAAARADVERVVREKEGEAAVAKSAEKIRAAVAKRVDEVMAMESSTERFVLRRFQLAAMQGLAIHGTRGDLRFARDLMGSNDPDLQHACVTLIRRYGDVNDVPGLIDLALDSYGDLEETAAEASLALSDDVVETAKTLIEAEDADLIELALAHLEGSSLEDVGAEVFALLDIKIDRVRLAAVRYLAGRLTRAQLRRLIDFYPRRAGFYYYNVVVYLDRYLYAPGWIRRALAEQD
jgi:hypothetical protein